jgi:multidrug efflux pump subunit AcrB
MLRSFVIWFARRPLVTLTCWLAAVVFGIVSYTSLLPREGFPAVNTPIALVNGAYLVDDAEQVDREVARPIAAALSDRPEVESVQSIARGSGFTVVVDLDPGLPSAEGVELVSDEIGRLDLPPEAQVSVDAVNVTKFLNEFDLLVGISTARELTAAELEEQAAAMVPVLESEPDIGRAEVVELVARGIDPATGQPEARESTFNLLTSPGDGGLEFRRSIAVGVVAAGGVDSLGLRDATDRALAAVDSEGLLGEELDAVVAIDFATQIRQQIGSLQSNVLTGVVAVALVALLLISWRASVVTGLFVMTVLATTVGVLYLIGISLNTISLFGVILALGLFVDDAIVITESIAAGKQEGADDLSIIGTALDRVGTASISGTLTTVLVFAPMLATSGILGDFIRILPITVIVALLVSLVLSFVFIPVATRYLVLPARSDRGPLTAVEHRLARAIAGLPLAVGRRAAVRFAAGIGLSLAMTAVGLGVLAPRVGFNIFPPTKDSTEIGLDITYPPGTTIDEARAIALDVSQQAADRLGPDLVRGYIYAGNERSALGQLSLTPIGDRSPAPALIDGELEPLTERVDGARVVFSQISAGPPEETFPFRAQLYGDDVDTLVVAAGKMVADLAARPIERQNGTTFSVVETEVGFTDSVARIDGRRMVELRARFDADDVTTTTSRARVFLEDSYGGPELAALGLEADALEFDLGIESQNQESFASLPSAFLVALLSMLVLLVIQFRSSAQWLLVFLAIPFSFFGVFGGLLLTGNVISFFVMLGLIGLIGIAVNNTILLTDCANQERRAGLDRGAAIESAIRQRFRPLVATSLTTVAGLLPLALSDPFWEALGMTIIFGLLSSTFLVLISFPFYYLAVEALRDRFTTPWRKRPARTAGAEASEPVPVG